MNRHHIRVTHEISEKLSNGRNHIFEKGWCTVDTPQALPISVIRCILKNNVTTTAINNMRYSILFTPAFVAKTELVTNKLFCKYEVRRGV